jgi:ribonuclease HI
MIKIYTDGGCRPSNPGPGGFAIVAILGDENIAHHAEAYHKTTNNRMELMAIIRAVQMYAPQHPLVIYTDSTYVANPVSSGRITRKTRLEIESKPNPDLWLELQSLLFKYKDVKVIWIKGHNGNQYNELADQKVADILSANIRIRRIDTGYQHR